MPAKTASFALLLLAATQLGGTSAQNLRAPTRIGETGKIIEKVNPDLGGLKIVEEAPLKSTRNISDKSATAGLPRTEIELGRFYNKDIRLERDRDGAYVVKSSFDLRRYEKPKIPLQLLDPQIIKDFNDDSELTGEGPDHLDFTANPKLIRDFMNSQLKQGEDKAISVFGTDDRYTYRDTSYPWSTVGRIVNDGGGVCTGTSIGKRLVLTTPAEALSRMDVAAAGIAVSRSVETRVEAESEEEAERWVDMLERVVERVGS